MVDYSTSGFSKRLRELVDANKLSVNRLSQATGVPTKTLYHWLAGQMPRKLDHLYAVAKSLNVSIEYLVFGFKTVQSSEVTDLPTLDPQALKIETKMDHVTLKIRISVERS